MDERPDHDFIRKGNIMIRHFAHTNPETLTDQQWAVMYKDVLWLLKKFSPYLFANNG